VAKATLLWLYAVGYTMDTMYFTWLDNPVDVDKDLQLPQFFLVDTPKFDCSQNYTAGTARRLVSLCQSLSPVSLIVGWCSFDEFVSCGLL